MSVMIVALGVVVQLTMLYLPAAECAGRVKSLNFGIQFDYNSNCTAEEFEKLCNTLVTDPELDGSIDLAIDLGNQDIPVCSFSCPMPTVRRLRIRGHGMRQLTFEYPMRDLLSVRVNAARLERINNITMLHNANYISVKSRRLDILPRRIDELSQLRHLDIHRANLTRDFFSTVPSHLTVLTIGDTTAREVPCELLKRLRHIEVMMIRRNKHLARFDTDCLRSPALRWLELQRNNISHFNLEPLNTYGTLLNLNLSDNPLECSCDFFRHYLRFLTQARKVDVRKASTMCCNNNMY